MDQKKYGLARMNAKLKKLATSPLGWLLRGSIVSQLVPIAATPLITRLYSPDVFGAFSILLAILSGFTVILAWRFEFATYHVDDKADIFQVQTLCMLLALVTSLIFVTFFVLNVFGVQTYLRNNNIQNYVYAVPLIAIAGLLINLFQLQKSRESDFKTVSQSNILRSISNAAMNIGFGVAGLGLMGLIVTQIISNFLIAMFLIRKTAMVIEIRRSRMRQIFSQHLKFPLFSVPASIASIANQSFLLLFFSANFSLAEVGYLALVQRILSTPSSFIANAVGQYMFSQAARMRREQKSIWPLVSKLFWGLIFFAIPTFLVVSFLGTHFIGIIFGASWTPAAPILFILAPYFATQFVLSCMSTLVIICERQELELILQLAALMSAGLSVMIFHLGFDEARGFLLVYTCVLTAYNLVATYLVIKLAK